jgi:hypothetical protein
MSNIVEECDGCFCISNDVCNRYLNPSKFQRPNGKFMCPSVRGTTNKEQVAQGKVRVGQKKTKRNKLT